MNRKQRIAKMTRHGSQKIVTAGEAASLIEDGDTIATSGFMMAVVPEEVHRAIERRFLAEGHPRDLTFFHAAGQGDWDYQGLNNVGYEGCLKRIVAGHLSECQRIVKLIFANKVEAYNLPQGVISQQFRNIAANKPGVLTHVGLDTFVDPRIDGAKLNDVTKEDLVEVVNFDNRELLYYKPFPIDVAIIRGTTADLKGNITMEKEALFLEVLPMAQAAKNSGGIVIAQVERIAQNGILNPQHVKVPGINVDVIVVASDQCHRQTLASQYNPAFSGEIKMPVDRIEPLELGVKKVIGRRAALELEPCSIVNLGIGIPEAVAAVAGEEGVSDYITLTIEGGIVGGVPAWNYNFGASTNADAIIEQPYQFDFYDGGGLDITFLGLAEIDIEGNVNVSKFAGDIPGCGGFINISQNTPNVIFCGAFTASGLKVDIRDGKIKIVREGSVIKFKKKVSHKTFSGNYARKTGQRVMVVTERAVFRLDDQGLILEEIAPGIDLQKDILDKMEFQPVIAENLKEMNPCLFGPELINMRELNPHFRNFNI